MEQAAEMTAEERTGQAAEKTAAEQAEQAAEMTAEERTGQAAEVTAAEQAE